MRKINCYTDGSAVILRKPTRNGPGGFATYFPNFYGKKLAFSKGFEVTKTGRMEVMALLYAIKAFYVNHKEQVELTVYSDSQYVTKTLTEGRLWKWKRADWTNTSGEVKNKDLWIAIYDALLQRPFMKLKMVHIRGHQVDKEKNPVAKAYLMNDPNIVGNMVADRLADYKRHTKLYEDKLIG